MLTLSSSNPSLTPTSSFPSNHLLSPTQSKFPPPAIPTNKFNFNPSPNLKIKCLNTPKPQNQETQIKPTFPKTPKLKIAIIGFGNFGQFLAKTLVHQGHTVLAYSRSDYSKIATQLRVLFFRDSDDLFEEHPEVILICTSILSTASVLRSLPLQRLKRNTLFVDVLSVKEFPRNLFLQTLPPEFDVLCTHPMFGPASGKNGWANLCFVFERVRIGSEESRRNRCEQFLKIFADEGCRMVEMSCREHDQQAAESQFITHTVGRMLGKLELQSTPINTKGYETLLGLVENTFGDSFDLYYGLFLYNMNATEQLERLEMAFDLVRKQLFGHLHEVLRMQVIENAGGVRSSEKPAVSSGAPENGSTREMIPRS